MFGGPRRFRCGLVEDGRWEGSILVRTAAAGGRHRANGEQGRHRHQNGHDLRSASGTSKTATSRPRTLLRRQGPRRGFAMNAVPLRRVVHRPGGADTESSVGLDLSFPAQNSQKAHDDSHQCQGDDEFDRRSGSYPYQSLTKLDRRFHEYTFVPFGLRAPLSMILVMKVGWEGRSCEGGVASIQSLDGRKYRKPPPTPVSPRPRTRHHG